MNRPIRSPDRQLLWLLILILALAACGGAERSGEAGQSPGPATAVPVTPASPTPVPATAVPTESATSSAADADVRFVWARQGSDGRWTFEVTVAHPDTGWEDYADGWDVVLPDGTVLKANPDDPFTRLLLHPHENEQPFTRSQSGLRLPEGVTTVVVRAHDLRDGFGGREVRVDLTQSAGPAYEVVR